MKIAQETIRGIKILPGLFVTENDYLCGRCDLIPLTEPRLDGGTSLKFQHKGSKDRRSSVSLRPALSLHTNSKTGLHEALSHKLIS